MVYHASREDQNVHPVAVIREEGEHPLVEIRNVMESGDIIEYMLPGIEAIGLTVVAMRDEKGTLIQRANPGNMVFDNRTIII